MRLKKKDWRSRATDILSKYLKLKVAAKTVKGVGKTAKWAAFAKAAKAVAERTPKKARLAIVGGGVGAAALAARRRRHTSASAA